MRNLRDSGEGDDDGSDEEVMRFSFEGYSENSAGTSKQRVDTDESGTQSVTDYTEILIGHDSGEWFAHDPETGSLGNGESRAAALAQLAEAIAHESGEISFSEDFEDDIEAGSRQVSAGDTTPADDVRSRLGIDD